MLVDTLNPHNNMPDFTNARMMGNHANLEPIRSCEWKCCSDVQEIIPGLYLGSMPARELLPLEALVHLGIRYLLEVSHYSDMHLVRPDINPSTLSYLGINLIDSETQNIIGSLPKAIGFIQEALSKQVKVLVCSSSGNSRSASLVLAYIMEKNRTTFSKALDFVRTKRPSVNPNAGFTAQLIEYEPIYKAWHTFTMGGSSSGGGSRAKRKLGDVEENDANLYNCPKFLKAKRNADSSPIFLKIS